MEDTMEYSYFGSVHYNDDDKVFYGKLEFIRALVSNVIKSVLFSANPCKYNVVILVVKVCYGVSAERGHY
jgi:hypothetical protein